MASEESGAVTEHGGSTEPSSQPNLVIVGAGTLGTLAAQCWKERHPTSLVYGVTRSADRHPQLRSLGVIPLLLDSPLPPQVAAGAPFVLFCVPPGGSKDYAGDVKRALSLSNGSGSFLFTSSSAAYAVSDNGPCPEDAPTVPLGRSPRVDALLLAEQAAIEGGGNVVRLSGLYTLERGAHTYWLRQGTVESRPDHILNLISYEDAASLCVAILSARTRGRTFMGTDNHPLSRQELMDITVASGKFDGSFNAFTGTDGPLGKRMNNDKTRKEVGWEPKYASFEEFLKLQ